MLPSVAVATMVVAVVEMVDEAVLDVAIDKDINTLGTIIPSVEIFDPMTRSRAQQLNHQVNSFLCSSAYNIESRLLPNDLIVLRN
jgi:hypothetical protein